MQPRAEREIEQVMQRSNNIGTRPALERIEEEQEVLVVPEIHIQPELTTAEVNVTDELQKNVSGPLLDVTGPFLNVTAPLLDASAAPRVSADPMELDIADMLTQKVETLSQQRKRLADQAAVISPKRQRSVGYMAFRESQVNKQNLIDIADPEANKENAPDNFLPTVQPVENVQQNAEKIVSSMLQEAGLADIQPPVITVEAVLHTSQRDVSRAKSRRTRSDSSETQLGSLDRTRVSLGDSEQTTDSKRFIRDQWGTEGTMLKILKFIKVGRKPVTISNLVSKGPVIAGHERVITARCFTSILKLKQHGFINVRKNPETLEINDITLGPKLASSQEQI